MRWRLSGSNWEGRRWTLVPCLVTLAYQLDREYPARHGADGTVASKGHDAGNPSSDHRPYPYNGAGEVRAIDVGETVEDDAYRVAEAIRKSRDKRIKYLIHEGRIFSSYSNSRRKAWEWGTYTGGNPHSGHLHLSTLASADDDTRAWDIGETSTPKPPPPPQPKPPPGAGSYTLNITRKTIKKGDKGADVAVAQSLLAQKGHPPANTFDKNHKPDGIGGSGFDAAVRSFQKASGLSVDGVVGPKSWAALEASN